MKNNPIFFFLCCLTLNALCAQNDTLPPTLEEAPHELSDLKSPATSDKTFEMFDIEKAPSFPGGEPSLMKFLAEQIQYPALARENAIQGTVALSFVVDKDGGITDIHILKDIGAGCGKEALRVLKSMPKWTPGEANGQPVKVRYTLPIRFKLEGHVTPTKAIPPSPTEEAKPASREQMTTLILNLTQKYSGSTTQIEASSPFDVKNVPDAKLLNMLEMAMNVNLSETDRSGFHNLGEVSDYFFKTQFAPQFYTGQEFKPKSAKILTNRADFDLNGDGIGKIGSLKVPQGIRIVLYSKKNFKGKKLELNAADGPLEIPDLSQYQPERSNSKDSLKGVNWSLNTKSVKVFLPKGFPNGQ